MSLSFAQIQHAWQVQDPSLVEKLCLLAQQPDPPAESPLPDDELTFERFLNKILSYTFRTQPEEVQFAERVAMIAKLEAEAGVYPLPDRYKIHLILTTLWRDNSPYARTILMQAINALPLSYGVWKGLKYIYKEAEYEQDYEMFACITAKIDLYRFDQSARTPVSRATKTYMSVRAWRYLRKLGQQMPIGYIEVATAVLASIDEHMSVGQAAQTNSWVLNHICFHNTSSYGVNRFHYASPRKLFDAKGRAFAEAWQRDSEPLIKLLATAKNEAVRQFATDSLKHDFKIQLRDVSCATIQYLSAGYAHSRARDELIVWLLEGSPHFEKSKFVALSLHEVVLKLLYSEYPAAYQYAIAYAKSYATDLPLSDLMRLALLEQAPVRQFAMDIITSRNPVTDVGVSGWGQLLDTQYHHSIAAEQLSKNFTRRDLTPEWFFARLTSNQRYSVDFAIARLPELYSAQELGSEYFIRVAARLDIASGSNRSATRCMDFVLQLLARLDVTQIEQQVWHYLLLHPLAQDTIIDWIDNDTLPAKQLDISYWHALAYEPDWETSTEIHALQTTPYLDAYLNINTAHDENADNADHTRHIVKDWQQQLAFDEDLADIIHGWLADVRRFSTPQLGFDWLMRLAHSEASVNRVFAINCLNKGFLPADFAITAADDAETAEAKDSPSVHSSTVNLSNQRYLFTGKMQSMSRSEAEKLVKAAGGAISSAVNGKLDYLVIGDEGSPFYGAGRKGSKQLKAEGLIAEGAVLKIISETAFLQMLTGQTRSTSEDDTIAGAEALWAMATADPDAPISEFAISYLSHHHEQICMALTDRPVDPNAVIPPSFFDAERVIPLLQSSAQALRDFGLLLTKYELSSWSISPKLWLMMAESPYNAVTELLQKALLDKPTASNRTYHVHDAQLDTAMLNALIGSKKRLARKLGMNVLQRHPQFQDPQSLYLLSQSADREVRYAAVTMLWQHYKARHVSEGWQPTRAYQEKPEKPEKTANHTADNTAAYHAPKAQPSDWEKNPPADVNQLLMLLRRGLFELPPGRLGNSQNNEHKDARDSHSAHADTDEQTQLSAIKPISASRAKLALIETFRDVGLIDASFAALIMPLLFTFTHSAGKMERHACLVAVTRLLHRYPELSAHLQPEAAS